MAKMSLDDLRKLRDSKKTDLRKRDVEGKEIQIVVGMGTCGIAAGAKQILDAFIVAIDENKLVDSCHVKQTGCMGLNPLLKLLFPECPLLFTAM
jgi:NADP-reducing hydrogenase subunit HndB